VQAGAAGVAGAAVELIAISAEGTITDEHGPA
jgi:hypothetical protein